MRDRHLSWEEILQALDSGQAENGNVRLHLTSCSRCARLMEEARAILGLLADSRLPVPPTPLVERTLARLASLSDPAVVTDAAQPLGLQGFIQRLKAAFRESWATLVADSLQPSPALRGTSLASPRALRYETSDYAVTLALLPSAQAGHRDVRGQLVPRKGASLPPGTCAAAARGEEMVEARVGSTGEFLLARIPTGSEEIDILVGDDWIRLRLPAD